MKKSLTKKSKKGFTLIELVVVIAILGILAAILIPIIGGFITRANVAAEQANARNLFNSVSIIVASGGAAPTDAAALSTYITVTGAKGGTWDYVLATDGESVESATYGTQTYNKDGSFT